ncbi:MAG TPA: sigma-70 family RNA polymerase sigma factor [Candidatus Aquicultor sp.]|jgi:RNA polymerase sigma-70 factor (ECF subfamily)
MDTMPNLRELVERAQCYDAEAFGQIYDHYYNKIFNFVYYKVGSKVEAEDLTEQVFLKALENIAGFEWRGVPFSSWLFRIASNLVVDFYRARKYEIVDIEDHINIQVDDVWGPEQSALRELERNEIVDAIKMLTEEQQQVITLRFIGGLSNEEVAQAINKSVNAVKALQHRAIGTLSKFLGGVRDGCGHR